MQTLQVQQVTEADKQNSLPDSESQEEANKKKKKRSITDVMNTQEGTN